MYFFYNLFVYICTNIPTAQPHLYILGIFIFPVYLYIFVPALQLHSHIPIIFWLIFIFSGLFVYIWPSIAPVSCVVCVQPHRKRRLQLAHKKSPTTSPQVTHKSPRVTFKVVTLGNFFLWQLATCFCQTLLHSAIIGGCPEVQVQHFQDGDLYPFFRMKLRIISVDWC